MNDNDKAQTLWNGTYLADREENGLTLQLYGVGDFYVEVYYDTVANKILRFRSFKSDAMLMPYLANIKFNLRF